MRGRHHGRKIVRVLDHETTARRSATVDDVKRSLDDLSARIDLWNEKRKGRSDERPIIHADSSEQRRHLVALNQANAAFWRARG